MTTKNFVYENVVFAQGEEATEPFEILAKEGEEAVIEYLSQWHDCGKHMTHNKPSRGSTDTFYEADGFILSWNHRFGYIGLEHKLNEDN